MYLRLTWIDGSADNARFQQAIDEFEQHAVAPVRGQPGFLGALLLVNRDTHAALAVAYWDSQAALAGSEPTLTRVRAQTAQAASASVRAVEWFELLYQERTGAPQVGTAVRLNNTRATTDPQKHELVGRYVRDQVAPLVRAQPGFRALLYGSNPQAGRGVVATVWNTVADRQASEAAVSGARAQATQLGEGQTSVELYEVAFAEVAPAATVAGTQAPAL